MFTVGQWPTPPPDGWEPLKIWHSRPNRKLTLLSLSHAPVGVYLHWDDEGKRYYPCLLSLCSCAKVPRKRVWKGYVHALVTSNQIEGIAELTHAASRGLATKVMHGSIRGLRIDLQRATMRRNSLLEAVIVGKEAIPEAFSGIRDLRPDLLYSWGYDPFGPSPWEVQS